MFVVCCLRLVFMFSRFSYGVNFGVLSGLQKSLACEAVWAKRLEFCF